MGPSEGSSTSKTDVFNLGRLPLTEEEVGGLKEKKRILSGFKETVLFSKDDALRKKEKEKGLRQDAVFHTKLWLEPLATMTHIKGGARRRKVQSKSTSGGLQSGPDKKTTLLK